jgi:uncharacterized membrane protein YbhN (UPF0104 family)
MRRTVSSVWQRVRGAARHPAVRRIAGGAIIAASVGFLGVVLARNWSDLAAYDWHINWAQVLLAFALYSLALGVAVLGWSLLMNRLAPATSLLKHLKYYAYTNLFRRLPVPLVYVVGRAYLYEQDGIAKSVSVAATFLEWAIIVLSGLLVCLCTLPYLGVSSVWQQPWLLASLAVVFAVLAHPRTIRAILRRVQRSPVEVSFGVRDIVLWLALYGVAWVAGGLVTFAAIRSFYPLPLANLPAVIGAWVLSGLVTTIVMASAFGLGVKEVTLTVLLSSVMPSSLAVVVALLMRVGLTLFEMIWGALAFLLIREDSPPS